MLDHDKLPPADSAELAGEVTSMMEHAAARSDGHQGLPQDTQPPVEELPVAATISLAKGYEPAVADKG